MGIIGGTANGLEVRNYIWNPSTLSWETATGGATPGSNVQVTNLPSTYPVTQSTSPWLTGAKLFDETSSTYKGLLFNAGSPQVCAQPYLQALAEGDISGHTSWTKIGYTPTMTTTESDIWSGAGVINFPSAPIQMQALSSNNTDDIGNIIFNGTSTDGSSTTLIDSGKNFTGGTAVAVGDCILLGTTKEYGFVTSVSATTLTCSGGFSSGGSGAIQTYIVIDKSATLGAQVVKVEYLDSNYATKYEFIVLNGTTAVNSVSTGMLRINSFRIITAGTNGKGTGNITLKSAAAATVYSYISAGYTRARNSGYTVPYNKTLYVVQFTVAYGYESNSTHYARIYTRATQNEGFATPGIFYPFTEVIVANNSTPITLEIPTRILPKVDMKVSGISNFSGIATVSLRGWLE